MENQQSNKNQNQLFKITSQAQFLLEESNPSENHYIFIYKISIQNTGDESAQLISRHWMITDANGAVEDVRGLGVVGIQPQIEPGQTFIYESACPMTTSHGSMKGYYFFETQGGESLKIEIPEFYLIAPQALH